MERDTTGIIDYLITLLVFYILISHFPLWRFFLLQNSMQLWRKMFVPVVISLRKPLSFSISNLNWLTFHNKTIDGYCLRIFFLLQQSTVQTAILLCMTLGNSFKHHISSELKTDSQWCSLFVSEIWTSIFMCWRRVHFLWNSQCFMQLCR